MHPFGLIRKLHSIATSENALPSLREALSELDAQCVLPVAVESIQSTPAGAPLSAKETRELLHAVIDVLRDEIGNIDRGNGELSGEADPRRGERRSKHGMPLADEAARNALMRALLDQLIARVAKRIGCPERLVTIEYENGYTAPGEASWLWTIRAEYQGPDRRKRKESLHGSGDTIAEAEDALTMKLKIEEQLQKADRLARKKTRANES